MAYGILLTSLYQAEPQNSLRHFFSRDGYRNYYCDALLTVEASAKHVLAKYSVDKIMDEIRDKKPNIVTISSFDVMSAARQIAGGEDDDHKDGDKE